MPKEETITIERFKGLNLFKRHLDIPIEEASFLSNVWCADASGALETRPGTALSGLASDHDFETIIRGMWRYYKDESTKQRIVYAKDKAAGVDKLYVLEAGAWVEKHAFTTSGARPYGVTLSLPDNLFFVANGTDKIVQWDGTTATEITISGTYAPKFVTQCRGHLLAWGDDDAGKVWFNTTAGDLTSWTFLDFYKKASVRVAGVTEFEDVPIVFTENVMCEIAGFPDDPQIHALSRHGLFSQRCLVDMGPLLMWAGRGPEGFGVYGWGGGQPFRLSKPIKTRYSAFDLANIYKSWAIAFKGYFMLFYPHVTDATNRCSRALCFNIETGDWYEWQDMHYSCGVWENANDDLGIFYLGSNKGVGAGDDEYYLYKITEGTYANPFNANGIETIWDTPNMAQGDPFKIKRYTRFWPHYKMLDAGGSSADGYIWPIVDGEEGLKENIDGTEEIDNVYHVRFGGISEVDFEGVGLDDMKAEGTFSGEVARDFVIEIDAEGTPDTFKWSGDGGATWTPGVAITGAGQLLMEGVEVNFRGITGHTLGERWRFKTGLPYKPGHYIRYRIYYLGTKGVRFYKFKYGFEPLEIENIAG